MKKTINGKMYDTENAECIMSYWTNHDFEFFGKGLYKNSDGEYFIAGEGGPQSEFAERHTHPASSGYTVSAGSDIYLITPEDAVDRLQLEADEIEAYCDGDRKIYEYLAGQLT